MSKRKKPIEKLDTLKLYATAAFFLACTPFFLFSSAPGGALFSITITIVAWRRARRLQEKDPRLPGSTQVVAGVRRLIRLARERYGNPTS